MERISGRRIIVALLSLMMIMALTPMTVSAASATSVTVGGVELAEGESATTDDGGAVTKNSEGAADYNVKFEGGKLYLKDANIVAATGHGISVEGDIEIVLEGEKSTVTGADNTDQDGTSDGIFATGDITITGSANLDATGGAANYSGGIFSSEGNITIMEIAYDKKVEATGGEGVMGSVGIGAEAGTVTIKDGTVFATGNSVTGGDGSVADGIRAYRDIEITDSYVKAYSGVSLFENNLPEYAGGIFSETGDITITGKQTNVQAFSGCGEKGIMGIGADKGNVIIEDATVEARAEDDEYNTAFAASDSDIGSVADGIRAQDDINISGSAKVYAFGGEANYSAGIFSENGNIIIDDNVTVGALGGRAGNRADLDAAGSAGISAEGGSITINGGEIEAGVGLTEDGIANGIRAHGNININGGKTYAVGALSINDGIYPEYSGGIFSETGNVTIDGENTVINAESGYSELGSTAIGAESGNIVIKDGDIHADGSYEPFAKDGLANGLSAVKGDDGTGGDIIISGGDVAAAGATDSIFHEGELIASPDNNKISMSVLGDMLMSDEFPHEPDWDKMAAKASEIKGSPFTAETTVERDLTEDMQYFSSKVETENPAPGTDDPADKPDGGSKNDGSAKTGDDMDLTIFAGMLVLSLAGAVTAGVYGRRRNAGK